MPYAIRKFYGEHPLTTIVVVGFIFRFVSVIFSKGFGWIDDQFLIIEIAQSWVDKTDYYKWLPDTPGNTGPVKFSFFYTGIIYYILDFLQWTGIDNPQTKMYFIRFLHALWSLLIIVFSHKITLRLSNIKTANTVAWLMALLWLFPFLSVRNLVEYVSIPLVLWALHLITGNNKKIIIWLIAGFLLGIAFNIRLQTALLTFGFALVLLFNKKIKGTIFLSLGFIIAVGIFQGLVDYYFWGYPFAQLIEYVGYNMESATAYTVGPWYVYLLFLVAVLVPPYSLLIFYGFAINWKKLAIIFVPVIIFLIFHSYYPNKQERFVVTIIPLIIISGVIGWNSVLENMQSPKWNNLSRGFIIAFWVINFILLLPITVMYSKKARVESMSYLSAYKQINYFVIEDVARSVVRFPPMYYLNKWVDYDAIMNDVNLRSLAKKRKWKLTDNQPDFVLFYQEENLDKRVQKLKKYLPDLVYETKIEPGNADRVLHWLNPINANENIYIYRNVAKIPEKVEL